MGIKDLLKQLKPIINSGAHLDQFRGKRAGVDASCWLHRSAHSCAWELVSGKGTDRYLRFLLKCIKLLESNGVTPVIVFDGAQLPMKANEEHRRNVDRDKAKREAMEAHRNKDWERRYRAAARAVRTTKEMIKGFIDLCVENAVEFVCSPYEADAQLGYMYKKKQIDFVISEDSDLLLYGVREVFYKLDVNAGGQGHYLNLDRIRKYQVPSGLNQSKKKMDLCLFLKRYPDPIEMIHVCVLSGCDYLNSLPGIGLKTAVKKSNECRRIELRVSMLMKEKKKDAPKDYHIQFKRAVLTFLHQRVYDKDTKQLTFLNPLTDAVDAYLAELKRYLARQPTITNKESKNPTIYDTTLNFLGKEVDHETARLVAEGKLDARSLQPRRITGMVGYRPGGAPSENPEVNEDSNDKIYGNRTLETSRLGIFGGSGTTTGSGSGGISASQPPPTPNVHTMDPDNTGSRSERKPEKKTNRFFGSLDNEAVVQHEARDNVPNKLEDLMAEFGYKDERKDSEETPPSPFLSIDFDDPDTKNTKVLTATDTVAIPFSDDEDGDMAAMESNDEEQRIEEHRPLKRPKNRKRKRSEMEQEPDIGLAQDLSPCPTRTRRRLNESDQPNTSISSKTSIPPKSMKPKVNPDTVPHSQFISKVNPKNAQSASNTSNMNQSIAGDLFWSAVSKLEKEGHQDEYSDDDGVHNKENAFNESNRTTNSNKNNPFSKKRKQSASPPQSLAMIGADCKPVDCSHSDSDSESDELVPRRSTKKAHSFLRYADKKTVAEEEERRAADKITEQMFGTQSQERSDEEDEQKAYIRSSQSASERQMVDQMKRIELQWKREEEGKDVEQEGEDGNDEDDDLVILSNNKTTKAMDVKKGKQIETKSNKKSKSKGFNPPRMTNGKVSPLYKTKAKPRSRGKTTAIKATKNKKTTKSKKKASKGQQTLGNFGFKKKKC